jgi:enamine deaminase RidA (YjgF/YER057c/UK114 family)
VADIETMFEVYPSNQKATIPHGIRINNTVYASRVAGVDTVTGEIAGDDLGAQMTMALVHVKTLVEKAGGTLDNVGRCVGYVTNVQARRPVYEPWDELFPDPADRPAFKALVTTLPPGHLVHLDALALLGERRTRIDIPNVPARDPSVRIGNWFFTSRCHGHDPATGKIVDGGLAAETLQILNNIVQLTELAGGHESDITQVTMFGRDDSYFEGAKHVFQERFPDAVTRPTLHQIVTFVTLTFQISIEGTAHVSSGGNR